MNILTKNDMTHEQWLEWRNEHVGIGGSDAPTIMRENPYQSRNDLWKQRVFNISKEENDAMRWGKEQEPKAIEWMRKKLGTTFKYDNACLDHPEINWMKATIDALDIEVMRACEIKSPYSNKERHQFVKINKKVPPSHYGQIQHSLEILNKLYGIDWMFFLSYVEGDEQLIEVGLDEKYIKNMIEEEAKFRQCIINLEQPDFVQRDEKWYHKAMVLKDLAEKKREIEKRYEEEKEELIRLSEGVSSMCGDITFKMISTKGRIDYEKIPELKSVNLDLYRKSPGTQWRLNAIA